MKITYLKLKNFIGIYNGLGVKEVEFDLSKGTNPITLLVGKNGSGKAQPNDNIVYTPNGFKYIGKLKVGDEVLTQNGTAIIDGVYPQGEQDVFKVTFNDDTYMLCNDNHLFEVYKLTYNRKREKTLKSYVKSVKELSGDLMCGNTLKWYIPLCEPANFKEQDVFIDPYIFGCLIGDGYMRDASITNNELDVLEKINSLLHEDYELGNPIQTSSLGCPTYKIVKKSRVPGKRNKYIETIKEFNLSECLSDNKFIPDVYKYNSIENRISLLQGLIDTDGSIEKDKCIYYYTCSKQLANDVKFIVESLGGNCIIHEKFTTFTYKGEKKEGKLQYRLFIKLDNITPFTSAKHNGKYSKSTVYKANRKIKSIEPLGYKTEMTCIHINDERHLYLTNNFIVTHNTSALSTLHPFSGTFDDKTSIILPNTHGYKEIHIDNNGILYKIQHYYDYTKKSKTIKSFIQRVEDDKEIELNENGGVRTFEEIIKNELDLVPSFLTLSRIGSNVSNFIDKKSTDRKKQITEFLPDIEDFLYNYKIINDKWSACKKDIKSVTDQINQIDTEDHLNTIEINEINTIDKLNKLIENERKLQTENNFRLNQLDPDGSIRQKYVTLGTEYNELTGKIKNLSEIDFGKYNSLEIVEKSLNDLNNKRIIRKDKLIELEKSKTKLDSKLINIEESLKDVENKYAISSGGKVLSEYYELEENYNSKISEYENTLDKFGNQYKVYDKFSNEDIAGYDEEYLEIDEKVKALLPDIDLSVLESVDVNLIDELSTKTIPTLTKAMTSTREAIYKLNTESSRLLSNLHQKDILEQRPSDCCNDECPFIKEALKFVNIENQLEKIKKKLDKANEKLKKQEEALSISNEIYNTYLKANSIYNLMRSKKVMPHLHYFSDMDISIFINEFLKGNIAKYKDITDIKDYIFAKNDLEIYKEHLKETKTEIKILEEKQVLLDSLKEQINKLNDEKIEVENEIETNITESKNINEVIFKLDKLEEILEKAKVHYTELNEANARINELKEQIRTISDTISEIKEISISSKEIVNNISQYERDLKPHINNLDKIKIDKANLKTFSEKKNSLDKVYNDLNIVRDALNPNKGIPLLFINTYLTKTKLIANNLLDVAFKGKFRIEEFEVTDKDFFIKLQKADGELLPDVIYASQGERALISLSISMALIQQSMSKYNILLLDEIDAELDGSNRKSFIEILENQFEMLGVEQCFLITHNNEFDSYNTNLMLFKDHDVDTHNKDYMLNKIIIFEAGTSK